MRHACRSLVAATMVAFAGTASAAEIEVMTQNQYLGAALGDVIAAKPTFDEAIVKALQTVAANLPRERATAMAGLIETRKPALVGLQEVYMFSCQDDDPSDHAGCEDQSIAGAFTDHLNDTLDALGGAYEDVATVVNMDIPAGLEFPYNLLLHRGIPFKINDVQAYLTVIDRDVILARTDIVPSIAAVDFTTAPDVPYEICKHPSGEGCRYQVVASAKLNGLVPVRFERGFVAVDATVDGRKFRFVNTHLETKDLAPSDAARFYQTAQATELLWTLGSTTPADRTLILTGDFNSDPRDPFVPPPLPDDIPYPWSLGLASPYQQFSAFGLTDVWKMRPGTATAKGAPLLGWSCCQQEDLTNRASLNYERVDLIWSLPAPRRVKEARLLGESIADKTSPKGWGLWPSDHASVAARLQY